MTTRYVTYFIAGVILLLTRNSSLAQPATAPNIPWGTWFIGTIQLPGGPGKWGGFIELQARTNSLYKQYFYNELKGGLSYDLDKNFTLTLAGGRYATYDYKALSDGPLTIEKRLWQQIVINQYLLRLKVEHRYRIEQRWFDLRDGTNQFRNRIRYRLNAFLPINHTTITNRTAFLSVYDEIFLNPKGPAFERNRFYAGLGYQIDKNWIVQLGCVSQLNYTQSSYNQGVYTPLSVNGKNNLVVSITYRISRHNGKSGEKLPSQQD